MSVNKIEATPIDMEEAHNRGECHFLCGICYHEGMVTIGLE